MKLESSEPCSLGFKAQAFQVKGLDLGLSLGFKVEAPNPQPPFRPTRACCRSGHVAQGGFGQQQCLQVVFWFRA